MAIIEVERSLEPITKEDLRELLEGSIKRLRDYFVYGNGVKWLKYYDIEQPLVTALCQGAALHYCDNSNGIKDFDIWFFYPFNQLHLPYRAIWTWDYTNQKFGCHPSIQNYKGRKVDVIVRSIRNYTINNPIKTIQQFLEHQGIKSAIELAKKAVVILFPESFLGEVAWYKWKNKFKFI